MEKIKMDVFRAEVVLLSWQIIFLGLLRLLCPGVSGPLGGVQVMVPHQRRQLV